MANLALLDLVLPYVFRGESLGPSHAALSALRVVTYESSNDDLGVTIRGHCEVNGSLDFFPGQGVLVAGGVDEATPAHDPSRSDPVFDLRDTSVDFELFVPRAGSAIVASAQPTFGPGASATGALFTDWTAAPGDYPSTGFTFDLILNAPKLRPPFLHPAKVSTIGVLEPDPSVNEVAITLPRMRFRISHGNPLGSQLVFAFVAAGVSDLDDPGSVEVSQFITMEPPYAYIGGQDDHVVGIGFRSATLDLDGDWTPPALRDKAQVGDDWTGLYLPEVRVFVSPDGLQNLAFECGAQELLIGVDRTSGIWGDFDAKLVQQGSGELRVMPRFTEPGGREYGVTLGAVVAGVRQATVALPQATTMVIDVTGGRTPYARVVRINGTAQPSATQYDLDLGATGTATVDLEVTSGSPTTPVARMHIAVTRLVETPRLPIPASPSSSTTTAQPATIESETGFDFELVQGPGDSVTILVVPPVEGLAWSDSNGPIVSGNPPTQVHGSSVTTQVVGGTTRSITATRARRVGHHPARLLLLLRLARWRAPDDGLDDQGHRCGARHLDRGLAGPHRGLRPPLRRPARWRDDHRLRGRQLRGPPRAQGLQHLPGLAPGQQGGHPHRGPPPGQALRVRHRPAPGRPAEPDDSRAGRVGDVGRMDGAQRAGGQRALARDGLGLGQHPGPERGGERQAAATDHHPGDRDPPAR